MSDEDFSYIGLNFSPPHNLIHAMSEIQQWYLAEKNGQPFDKNFFTMSHTMAYSKVAIKSAFWDSLMWIGVYVFIGAIIFFVQENYLVDKSTDFLLWKDIKGSPVYWFSKISSFGSVVFSTTICIMMGRFYTGVIPKKAINTIFTVRSIFLACFALVAFVLLGVTYRFFSDPMFVNNITSFFSKFNQGFAYRIDYFVAYYFRRMLFESAITAVMVSLASIVIPFIAISTYRFIKQKKEEMGVEEA